MSKTKLITTKEYLLLIDEEAKIKPDDYIIHDTVEGIVEANDEWHYRGEKDNYWNKVIAFYPLTKEAKELDLPLLPSFEDNFDLKQEIIRWYHSKSGTTLIHDPFLNEIVDKAQSKQFSLEDLKKAIEMAREIKDNEDIFDIDSIRGLTEVCTYDWEERYSEEEIIQSLSTQQLPISFEPEFEYVLCKSCDGAGWMLDCGECRGYGRIETTELRITTNSEGKGVLMGEYKY